WPRPPEVAWPDEVLAKYLAEDGHVHISMSMAARRGTLGQSRALPHFSCTGRGFICLLSLGGKFPAAIVHGWYYIYI
ncbi:MAG: hypothetical protein LBP92_13445, partial [Deltaproteobacteria bacterium]|nr:hypothetical protein [Deltaproteobacteria bacterium]